MQIVPMSGTSVGTNMGTFLLGLGTIVGTFLGAHECCPSGRVHEADTSRERPRFGAS